MSSVIFKGSKNNKIKKNIFVKDILKEINLEKNEFCIAYRIKNKLFDFHDTFRNGTKIFIITNKNYKDFFKIIQVSCMQLLHYAVKTLWPNSKSANSVLLKEGFYCDFEMEKSLNKNRLSLVFNKMKELCNRKYIIIKKKFTVNRLIKILYSYNEYYQIKILHNSFLKKNALVNVYFHNNYFVFIPGIQVYNIKFYKNFLLTKFSGVYWDKKNNNKILQRIYGVAFSTKKELEDYVDKNIYLSKIDHRKLGATLDLYHIDEQSPGMIFWHNNGFTIFELLKNFLRKTLENHNYKEVITPIIMNKSVWKNSGHFKSYKKHIFNTFSENKNYCIKPMNCPGHIKIFNENIRSYKDLPFKLSEFGICHRNEYSGSLHGLMRARSFTQDDAHIFCSKKQIELEISNCIDVTFSIYRIFNFKIIKIYFSTRPENSIGDDNTWDFAEKILKKILKNKNIAFSFKHGSGAFYGPKIEFVLQDRLGRNWQCGTIQLDFYIAKRLKVFYINKSNIKRNPIIIHRAILGSLERFIGILLEEYNGNFPLWLTPVQIVIMSISNKNKNYVLNIFNMLKKYNFRVIYDINNITINAKIRKYSSIKIPYFLICGDKEEKKMDLTVRNIKGNVTKNVFLKDFIKMMLKKIHSYSFC
ncbi:threonine--tRNA ligase [Buchnera aphidicola (Chaitoregma tattakana)]|uniref:threonine--tRNA ligase n=1 Tax=Buchnera aphidicola TaxID=9 RepID=UPI0031B87C84